MPSIKDLAYLPTSKRLRTPVWKLLEWHDKYKRPLQGAGADQLDNPWTASQPRQNGRWLMNFAMQFPEFVEDVKALPFSSILRISFLESTQPVAPHQDLSRDNPDLEPCSYRCFLVSDNTFWLAECPEDMQDGKPKRVDFQPGYKWYPKPDYGQWWLMNNQNSIHGCDEQRIGSKKVIVSIWGTVDPDKHRALLRETVSQNTGHAWNEM